jgi:hypothetical protein
MQLRTLTLLLAAAATTGCVSENDPSVRSSAPREGSQTPAEWACKTAVAKQLGITNPDEIRVISSEASQAGTSVSVSAPTAQAPWSCVIDTDGSVARVYYTAEG